ncbi:MAG: hypothetical protein ACP5QG_08425 [candidate division WOR-3 bacterium]
MSLWKQNKVKKQQQKKRTKKVLKARDEVLSLLLADKVKKAGEVASAMMMKHPGDIRTWRLVAGVKAWERFDERLKGIPSRRRDELKSRALKVMKKELSSRDNLRAEVLAETLISLVPAGEFITEEVSAPAEEPATVSEVPVEEPAEKAKAPATKRTSSRSSATKKTRATAAREKPKKATASGKKATSTKKKTE